ncbi:ParA family protein [Lactococcus lactis]|uniref:ParA family protein n=1 Tax=Lactococcus lactis TaxID=1358 RepID=UPI0009C1390A|nr:AAA family ATPase [Lactococcus lactis]ARE11856.2 AAA family ATPase [Lactococcus lactis subsp. lactis]URL08562.1 AAA family ATPase [Lactococcus lactis subsp. lactis]
MLTLIIKENIVAKIISFFNHKGGVGKTTLAYNVAWSLAEKGKKVLMLDGDAQANLTEIAVDNEFLDDYSQMNLFANYDSEFFLKNNVYEYFVQYIEPTFGQEIREIELFQKSDNLKLLAGSLRFAELEESVGLSMAGISALSHIPTSVYQALQKLGEGQDYIIVDLSPALSAVNQLFVMLSDYFIVPVNPSIFSRQALRNLNQIFRGWNRNVSDFEIFARKTKQLPKMLGIVCQNYRPFSRKNEQNTKSAKRFEQILDELNDFTIELADDLNGFGMAVTPKEFKEIFEKRDPYRIANIPDYNQLAMVSEKEQLPVQAITSAILTEHDLNTDYYRDKVSGFKEECDNIVGGLLNLLDK